MNLTGRRLIIKEGNSVEEVHHKINSDFVVYINGDETTLTGKKEYIFVDIFEYFNFDRSRVRGNLICKINSQKANYTDILRVGDNVEVYWEE